MNLPRHVKTPIIITSSTLGLLVLALVLHNFLTLITGKQDKIFFLFFIILFYSFPILIVISLIWIITPYVKKFLETREANKYHKDLKNFYKNDNIINTKN